MPEPVFLTLADPLDAFVSGDFFVRLSDGRELLIPVQQGIELGHWLASKGTQIALETAELALDSSGRGIR